MKTQGSIPSAHSLGTLCWITVWKNSSKSCCAFSWDGPKANTLSQAFPSPSGCHTHPLQGAAQSLAGSPPPAQFPLKPFVNRKLLRGSRHQGRSRYLSLDDHMQQKANTKSRACLESASPGATDLPVTCTCLQTGISHLQTELGFLSPHQPLLKMGLFPFPPPTSTFAAHIFYQPASLKLPNCWSTFLGKKSPGSLLSVPI